MLNLNIYNKYLAMDILNSTSSESELESKIKLRPFKNGPAQKHEKINQSCVICQETGKLVMSKQMSKQKFIECTKERMDICQGADASFFHIFSNFNHLKERNDLQWHKNCYKTYTSSKNIASYLSKYAKISTITNLFVAETSQKRSLRTISFDVHKCVFCQKRLRDQKLCQVMTKNMEDKIKTISRSNQLFYSRIGTNDLIASEIKYHASCISTECRNVKDKPSVAKKRKLDEENEALQELFSEMKIGLEKGKGYSTTSVSRRYRELGGLELSDRVLVKKIEDHFGEYIELVKSLRHNEPRVFLKKFSKERAIETILQHRETGASNSFCGPSELQILTKICQSIKEEIKQIPTHSEFKNLNIHEYKKCIPDNLYFLIALLVCNEPNSDTKETQIINICQDIIFACSNAKKYTPKHIGLGILVHQETRSKKLVEAIHACGHSISYIDTLRVRNSIAQEEIKLYFENDQVTIPRQLVPNRFVQFAADNIDILEETLDKAPTFHGTQMAAFQRGPINEFVPGNFELLPYKKKLIIPNDFHSLESIQFKKATKKVHPEENPRIIIEKGKNVSYDIKYQNIAWSMCRMVDSEKDELVVPQWSGFHKLIFENKSHTTTYGYLPLLPHVSSDYDTVWTVIKKCSEIAEKLNNMHTVITFDQAIYYKAKELQWHKPEDTKNVIVCLGGFHVTMNFLKILGQYMAKSGLADVWLESGLYGESTVDGILAGKKYNKAVRAHKITYESLTRILISTFNKWLIECKSSSVHSLNLIRLCSSEIRDQLERKEDALPSFYKISNLTKELFKEFPQFIETQTATFKYWYTYLELVEILLEFLFAERNGNWELHLNSFRKMLPWFFAFDHTNYSRWGTIYLLDMYKLPDTAPAVFNEFKNGNFVVKRLEGNFNQLSIDQALEHINKSSKDAGGIVGLTKNSTKLDEWFLSYNVVGMMLDEFRSSLCINNSTSSQNVECGVKRMKVDEDSVQRLQSELSRFNVFSKNEDRLLVISTNEIAPATVETALLTAQKTGEEALSKFLDVVGTPAFYEPLRKNNLQTFQHSAVKVVPDNKKIFQKGQEFLQKILAAKEMGRNIKYEDIFKHELTVYPMSLAPNGIISTPSNKSALGNIIETFTLCCKDLPLGNYKTCHIFDGMALVQSLGKPANAKSFGDYANILKSIVFKNVHNAERIDLVMDHYEELSIKNCTRQKRGLKETIERAIDSPDTLLPQQWHLFIHSIFNKKKLTNFLSNQLYEHSVNLGLKFVTSGGFLDVLQYKSNYNLVNDLLVSSHEEADTRIILHIISAKMEGYTRCVVDCKDTDVLVLLACFKDMLTPEVWMKVGTKEKERFIAIHELNMDSQMSRCLPAFHALTGCDTTSQFVGLGKKTCFKVFLLHYNLLAKVGADQHFDEEVFNNVVKFVIRLYTTNENIKCINTLRGVLASLKPINKLPPTLDTLKQHFLRVHYQTKIWLNSMVPRPSLPNLENFGWNIENGKLAVIFTTESILPNDTSVLNTFSCKKGHSSTTGSCASSSGASGSGSSSRRAARQHKVGAAAPAPLSTPASHAAVAMASDQPDLPNNGLTVSEELPSPQEATQALGASGGPSGPGADSESDDSEVGRLQALLEARGLPPHLFGALGPRMQHLLHRSMGANSSVTKAQQLLQGLQATGDEGQQLQAVIEMCQLLVMGNEDTLTGFPIKQVVPALINLLQVEHNFDMMNHACRALTYMMEALPRSSAVVVDAVPVFLEKLQVIQCMDVAEQSLTALDMLSRRHSKAILQARGVQACLMYLDFFSINAQRNALSITANCCLNLTSEEFQFVSESLSLLANRLTQQDKKSVESVCLAFSRLVDSFQSDPSRLQEIAGSDLLTNLQQLLVVTPPVISTATFISVLRMLSIMCASCPDLAFILLKQNIAETLLYLLTGSVEANQDEVELVSRQPQELYEITALIGELMPKLPSDGIFAVDSLLERPSTQCKEQPAWQWRDDRGMWHPYSSVDSRTIETSHISGDDEQINEDTGTSRPVQRRYTPSNSQGIPSDSIHGGSQLMVTNGDARVACLREEHGLAASFIRSLFSVLYEVYSSSAGPAVRCKCLKALLRMVYYATPELLKEVLKNQIVSSHIAGMMASSDLRIVVGALQMADILMTKLPDVFGVHFRREGVMHQITQLTDPEVPLGVSPPKSTNSSTASSFSTMTINDSQPGPSQPSSSNISTANGNATITPAGTPTGPVVFTSTPEGVRIRSPSPSHIRLSDVLKRKRAPKRSTGAGRSKTRHEDLPLSPSLMQDLFTKAASLGTSTPSNSSRQRYSGSTSKTSSFLSSLNPVRWGRSMNSSSHDRNFTKDTLNSCLGKSASNSNLTAGNREKTRTWIREQASKFIDNYSENELSGPPHPALNVLTRLTSSIQKLSTQDCGKALVELREILIESDISPFEVNHSGLIKALLNYLAEFDGSLDRDQRIRIFLNVFAALPVEKSASNIQEIHSAWMGALVAKLSGCVSQLEQFPVKVHDLPASSGAGRGGTSALKFFNTHQLKCNLQRHPDCTNLKQWKGGTVKIDPLALVQAIERYLVVRGYGRIRDKDSADSDDADSDDDIDDTLAAVVISQSGAKHKLQFLIGNHVLPYNMTVYQAIRQYSVNGNDQSETDTDNETPLGNAGIWVQTHTIYYKPIKEDPSAAHKSSNSSNTSHSGRKGKGSGSKNVSRRKGDELWNEGITPMLQSPLSSFLKTKLPESVDIQDASLEVLCLLRILNALNLYWNYLYPALEYKPILPGSDFLNSKIAAKASRQLQDPLVIMTGNLPNWLQQIASVCPFLFPFETRQLLFYVTSFDRDRALQRLLDMSPELTSADSQERVTPRLDRRKRTISRDDILKQAEQVISDLASSKALLEVQYEDEVGTGLGPTLEFYALVSKELQKTELELWHSPDSSGKEYVYHPMGLFPAPLGRGAKVGQISKTKTKFRFLGKFMAKAVMDSRMLDLPFSLTFYRWLLGQEHSLTMADLLHISPEIHKTLRKMQEIVRQRNTILENPDISSVEKNAQIEKLNFDDCSFEDLSIDFMLPGYNVELMKNGKTTHVSIHNVHHYTNLVTHWFLVEGVSRQLEAFREGFESVFPIQNLKMFHPEELEAVFCGNPRDTVCGWDVKTLMECCKPDHGYTADSRAIKLLFEVLSSYNRDEQRLFIQFLTGTPRLPVGGFKALSPPLTVVRTTLEPNQNADDFLPSVMTCVNYLKLPDYSSIDVLREKLRIAASEGQHSFHLS